MRYELELIAIFTDVFTAQHPSLSPEEIAAHVQGCLSTLSPEDIVEILIEDELVLMREEEAA